MKNIALFGGSGKTGQQFLKQALEAGYNVKALVRNPEKISQNSAQLKLIHGDVLDQKSVEETIQGADIIVSLFGHVKGSPDWLQKDGTTLIVESMNKNGIKRIISLSGGGLPYPGKDEPKFFDHAIRTIMKITVPSVLKDAQAHAEVLRNSSLDWEIVRGPILTDTPLTGKYRVGWVGVNAGNKISRADLAHFIMKEVESPEYTKQLPMVSY